jgi:DNA-directed RNA polymerase subunit RPC12/RpoP
MPKTRRMIQVSPEEQCSCCGGWLFPPELAGGMKVPATADYVCVQCGHTYKWQGNPPVLIVLAVIAVETDENDDVA